MIPSLNSHPAVVLGTWLRTARQARGLVKRIFAGQICLDASKYTEVEAGVVRWLTQNEEKAILSALDLSDKEVRDFERLLADARKAQPLTFSNLFTENELAPVRLRSSDGKQMSVEEKNRLIAAVFTPLV